MQHVNLPLAEKLLRLEKLKLRSSARSGDVRGIFYSFLPISYCWCNLIFIQIYSLGNFNFLNFHASSLVQQISLSANNSSATEIPPKSKLRVQKDVSVNEVSFIFLVG